MNVVETSIADLRAALDSGGTTSVELVAEYLNRIGGLDHHGPTLNSVPVLNPDAFAEARASDLRRAQGRALSSLDGIPYTAKDSYRVEGLPVSAGSPAFADLIAGEDAFSIARLRDAGAICLGLTTMPPMANGGMQRGLHGRAESPYNPAYLTSAWASGSSNGSGTATAASLCAFGLGEETWSSGRAPANNNSLCAYTPSWGVISTRGNWPLVPSMDVVVPHTRSMADLLEVLDVLVADDPTPRGDFWRVQSAVEIPRSSELRPVDYAALTPRPLAGVRLGVPRVFVNQRPTDAGTPVETRPGVVALLDALVGDLRAAGAEVVECDLPALTAYEGAHAHLSTPDMPDGGFQGGLEDLGYLPRGYLRTELEDLAAWSLDDFLRANAAAGGAGPRRLTDVDANRVFPLDPGQIPDEYGEDFGMGDYVGFAAANGCLPDGALPGPSELPIGDGLRGLDCARRELFDDWLSAEGLDALIFPTCADIAPADADQNLASHEIAWRNGTWVANGNLLWRHLGIPTVTLPMGLEPEARMPFGATLAGAGWNDVELLRLALAVEASTDHERRVAPALAELPRIIVEDPESRAEPEASFDEVPAPEPLPEPRVLLPYVTSTGPTAEARVVVEVVGDVRFVTHDAARVPVTVCVDGVRADTVTDESGAYRARVEVPSSAMFHSHWTGAYGHVVVLVAHTDDGPVGALAVVDGV
ncbi:amidase [Galactobacter sp.]|uniref:amidase n=1 Tax=Galactobacter sp. TaxID=2676125 RepID=UPI0025BFBD9C|nr:amidase [Galactobacter sp.]